MRTRDLKPGFFRNEELSRLAPVTRLLYEGLWLIADKKGRLLDVPPLIKADIFPFENVPVEKHLKALDDARQIRRYEEGGRRLIWIPTFLKHQHPHPKEPESVLPPHPEDPLPGNVQATESTRPGNVNSGDFSSNHQPLTSNTLSTHPQPPTAEEVLAGRKPIFKFYEQLFGKTFGPTTAERLIEIEASHSAECIEHCFQEAADAHARTPTLLYRILDRHATEGCFDRRANGRLSTPEAADSGVSAEHERLGLGQPARMVANPFVQRDATGRALKAVDAGGVGNG